MKKSQLLNKLDKAIDKFYDELYNIKEVLERPEDEELDFLASSFVDQIELSVVEGEYNYDRIKDYIDSLFDEE